MLRRISLSLPLVLSLAACDQTDPKASAGASTSTTSANTASARASTSASASASAAASPPPATASASATAPAASGTALLPGPTATASAAAVAPAAGAVPWAADFTGAPEPALEPNHLPGDIGVASHHVPKSWRSLALGDGFVGSESPTKTAVFLEKFGPLATIDAAVVEKWSKTLLPSATKHDPATGVIAIGPGKLPVKTGHATLTLKGKPAELYWFDVASKEKGSWLYMIALKDGCDAPCKKEAVDVIRSITIAKGQTPKYSL